VVPWGKKKRKGDARTPRLRMGKQKLKGLKVTATCGALHCGGRSPWEGEHRRPKLQQATAGIQRREKRESGSLEISEAPFGPLKKKTGGPPPWEEKRCGEKRPPEDRAIPVGDEARGTNFKRKHHGWPRRASYLKEETKGQRNIFYTQSMASERAKKFGKEKRTAR